MAKIRGWKRRAVEVAVGYSGEPIDVEQFARIAARILERRPRPEAEESGSRSGEVSHEA